MERFTNFIVFCFCIFWVCRWSDFSSLWSALVYVFGLNFWFLYVIKAQLSSLSNMRASSGISHGAPTRQIHISSTISSPTLSSYLNSDFQPPPRYQDPLRSSSSSYLRNHNRLRDHTIRDHTRQHSSRRRPNFSMNPSPLSFSFISSSDHYSWVTYKNVDFF